MSQQVPFIGREEELSLIDYAVGAQNERRIIFIDAHGGIGKTRLLQEVRNKYIALGLRRSDLVVTDIIDYDDPSLHIPLNLGIKMARMLDDEVFKPYLEEVLNLRKMEAGDVGEERLKKQQEELNKIYVDCFNKFSENKRIILFEDTAEVIPEKFYKEIFDPQLQFQNCVILVAGRKAKEISETLQLETSQGVEVLELPPLTPGDSRTYLQYKQSLLHLSLDKDLAEKLLFLAGGKPIVIDLAVEWIARDIPLSWLAQTPLDEIKNLPESELTIKQKEFEHRLVLHISETRRPVDWLFLAMSYVYPLDNQMIVRLLRVDKNEAQRLFEEALTYPFVKRMPDNRIKLHDEMQRMINQNVWREVDPHGDLQKQYSDKAIGYLGVEIQGLEKRIETLEADSQVPLGDAIHREVLKEELWGLREQRLKHTLALDVENGLLIFTALFDEATRAYRPQYRKILLDYVEQYIETLTEPQKFEYYIRYAKYLLDSSEYENARKYLNKINTLSTLVPEQYIDTHIQLANVVIRLGKFLEGIEEFKKALVLSQKYELREWQVKAETGLGWAFRLIADFEQAKEHYDGALDIALKLGDSTKRQQALLYNNLGFVLSYYFDVPGHREQAQWFCQQSLELAIELEDKRAEGRSYCTLGCIQMMDGRFHHAMESFRIALDIFEPTQDLEWLSTIYSWRGAIYISWHELEKAEEDIRRSLSMGIQKDTPLSLSRLAMIDILRYLKDRNSSYLVEAVSSVDECYTLSTQQKNVWYELIALRDKARVAFYTKQFVQLKPLKHLLKEYIKTNPKVQERRALGMLYLFLGGLALGQENTEEAINLLQNALQELARIGRYGGDTLPIHFQRLEEEFNIILHISPATVREIGRGLLNYWEQDKTLRLNHPDVRTILIKWANWR